MNGHEIRKRKLLGDSGRAVVVACDHGMFDGPHAGMERIAEMLEKLGDGPDGILLSPGMLPKAAAYFGRRAAPVPVTRLSFNSVFCFAWGYTQAVQSRLFEPGEAMLNGAAGVVFGRNAVQSSNPPAFVAALQDIVKRGMTSRDAAAANGFS